MKNTLVLLVLVLILVSSCERKPFIKHSLKLEKVGDDCNKTQSYFRLVSNTNGQRFEFEKCLTANYTPDEMKFEQRGDTVQIWFHAPRVDTGSTVYKATLDIDSYPQYHILLIDENTFTLTPAKN